MSRTWPPGTRLALDPDTHVVPAGPDGRDGALVGGARGRLVRLSSRGAETLDLLLGGRGEPTSAAESVLARRLVEAGLAHPDPVPVAPDPTTVTVVIPVLDRVPELTRCLDAVGADLPVIVVDDGSADPAAIAAVCRRAGARLLRHPINRGPSAARNTGLAAVTTPFVAFVDSDCEPPRGWLDLLLGHLGEEEVAVVAPRVVPRSAARSATLRRYAESRSPLDLGTKPAAVEPYGRVSYVPSAALLIRRAALADGAFDEALRCGEDVDLVWRLHKAGWTVRYEPRSEMVHHEPASWRGWVRRRRAYGMSVGPLAQRHPGDLAHVSSSRPAVLAGVAVLLGRPALAAAALLQAGRRVRDQVRQSGMTDSQADRLAGQAVLGSLAGVCRGFGMVGWPLLMLLIVARPRRWLRVVVLLGLPPLAEWTTRRPPLDPLRWTAASMADDLTYGAAVIQTSVRHRTLGPLTPRLRP